MAKLYSKQRLSVMDMPDPIPANLHNLDLSYAIDTFHVSTYRLEDLPETLPVFSKRTGKLTRFLSGKRVMSMPILSREVKSLPQVPPKPTAHARNNHMKRSASMFPQNTSGQECLGTGLPESSDEEKQMATAKNTIIDEEDDSLFSKDSIVDYTSASSVPSEIDGYTQGNRSSRKSIFEINGDFVDDSSSSIYSETDDDTVDDTDVEEMCVEEPKLGSIFDGLSLRDSLWDSDKESIKSQTVVSGSYTSTSILEYYRATSEVQIDKAAFEKAPLSVDKKLPNIPHSPVDSILAIPKVRQKKKPRPSSMFSMTNQSNFSTLTGSKSLHDCKHDLRSAVDGSIDVCLDSDRDYRYSRYNAFRRSKPRSLSTTLMEPLLRSKSSISPIRTKPRAFSAYLMNTVPVNGNTTSAVQNPKTDASHKPKSRRSVSALLASKFRTFSSKLRPTNK